MGRNLPAGRKQSLVFLESLIDRWTANQADLGITSAAVADLTAGLNSARDAFTSVETARIEAVARTQHYYSAVDDAHRMGSQIIASIKAFANASNTTSDLYQQAGLTPRNPLSPSPAPEQPANGTASLGGNGAVLVNFEARGTAGTVWQVWRQLGTETAYSFIGNADSRSKSFADNTVPAGESSAQYTVQGVRGNVKGPVGFAINVQFGGVTGARDVAAA